MAQNTKPDLKDFSFKPASSFQDFFDFVAAFFFEAGFGISCVLICTGCSQK
jgi:hypothetical protein